MMTAEADRERDAEDRRENKETIQRIFEMLTDNGERLATLETKSDMMSLEIKSLNATVAGMRTDGCALGKQQQAEIRELKERPAKVLALAVGISTFLSGMIAILAMFWRHEQK